MALGADHASQSQEISDISGRVGLLPGLNTTDKLSIVRAINEVLDIAQKAEGVILDTATSGTNKTYSIDKIISLVSTLKQEILGGVPAATFDTLKEIADYIQSDQTATSGLLDAVSKRVRYDAAMTLTAEQKLQARTNIDAYGNTELGNVDTDLVALYETAKDINP